MSIDGASLFVALCCDVASVCHNMGLYGVGKGERRSTPVGAILRGVGVDLEEKICYCKNTGELGVAIPSIWLQRFREDRSLDDTII